MKKLIFILAIVFIMIGTATAQTAEFKIKKSATEKFISTDYTLTNTVESWFLWDVKRSTPATQDFQVEFSQATGTQTRVDVVLYGRKFSGDAWVSIGTANWQHGVNDSLVTISNVDPNRYREYKTGFTGTGTGTSTIDSQQFKIWDE